MPYRPDRQDARDLIGLALIIAAAFKLYHL